jgi:hypothetical protein
MKEYNREKRCWEEKSTEVVSSLKKKLTCRGGKPHSYQLIVPEYLRIGDVSEEDTLEFYASMDRIYYAIEKEYAIQDKLGLKRKWNRRETRCYACATCGKRDYDYMHDKE